MQEKTDKIIKDSSFEEIEQPTLVKLLEQSTLMVASELDLIDASLRWAKREAEHRDLLSISGSVLRDILGPAFGLLRFLTLVPSQFASGPALSDLLTRDESFAILVNLNSPGSMDIPDGICRSTQQRICPQNDSFTWDAHLHSTNLCERQSHIDNTGTIECSVTFTASKNVRIIGIQVPSQITQSGKITEVKAEPETYSELVIISLVGSTKNLLSYVHFEAEIQFNNLLDILFEQSVEVKQLEEHTLRIWLHRKGRYPQCKLEPIVQCGDVTFKFQGTTAENDVLRSLTFTPSSSSDSKTFKFTSQTPQEPNTKPRKFHFVPRKTSPFKI
jgi:hypothetical protein